MERDKVTIVKLKAGGKDIYVNGVKVNNLIGFNIFDKFEDGWASSQAHLEVLSPEIEYVNEDEYVNEPVMCLENNTDWISELAKKLFEEMSNEGGDLSLMIDGSFIGKIALDEIRKEQRKGGITLQEV